MSLPDCLGQGISKVSIIFSFDMHNQGDRLYVTRPTTVLTTKVREWVETIDCKTESQVSWIIQKV